MSEDQQPDFCRKSASWEHAKLRHAVRVGFFHLSRWRRPNSHRIQQMTVTTQRFHAYLDFHALSAHRQSSEVDERLEAADGRVGVVEAGCDFRSREPETRRAKIVAANRHFDACDRPLLAYDPSLDVD